jgi:hypothetical protein
MIPSRKRGNRRRRFRLHRVERLLFRRSRSLTLDTLSKEEIMPNLSGSFSGRATSQSTIALDDVSNHDLNLLEVRGVQKSPDEQWNNSKITYWGTADLIAGNGPQRGYFVNEHSGATATSALLKAGSPLPADKSPSRAPGNLPAARESSRV